MKGTIIISGKSGSGKDMVAEFMKEALAKHGQKALVIHFADAVKDVCTRYFDWDGKKDEIGRTLLQMVGTDIVRKVDPDFWTYIVDILIKSFVEQSNNFDVAIIADARFPNEVNLSLENLENAVSVRIERKNADGTVWINPILTEDQRNHPSETSLDVFGFDYIIHNDEGLDLLRESAQTVLRDLGYIKE